MQDDTAHDDKPHHKTQHLPQILRVLPHVPVRLDQMQEFHGHVQIKRRAHAYGPEVAHEYRVGYGLALPDLPGHQPHDGQSPEGEDQEPQHQQPIEGDAAMVMHEIGPRAHGAEPHENGQVDDHIDGRREAIRLRLRAVPVVPVEDIAGDETGQEVIGADDAARPHDEEAERDGKEGEVLMVNPGLPFGES